MRRVQARYANGRIGFRHVFAFGFAGISGNIRAGTDIRLIDDGRSVAIKALR